MLVPPLKSKGTKTMKYCKYLPVVENLIKELTVEKPNQVWVKIQSITATVEFSTRATNTRTRLKKRGFGKV